MTSGVRRPSPAAVGAALRWLSRGLAKAGVVEGRALPPRRADSGKITASCDKGIFEVKVSVEAWPPAHLDRVLVGRGRP